MQPMHPAATTEREPNGVTPARQWAGQGRHAPASAPQALLARGRVPAARQRRESLMSWRPVCHETARRTTPRLRLLPLRKTPALPPPPPPPPPPRPPCARVPPCRAGPLVATATQACRRRHERLPRPPRRRWPCSGRPPTSSRWRGRGREVCTIWRRCGCQRGRCSGRSAEQP